MTLYDSKFKNQFQITLVKLTNLIYVLLYFNKTQFAYKIVKLLNYFNKLMLYFFNRPINIENKVNIVVNDNLFNFFLLNKKFKYKFSNTTFVYFMFKKYYYTKNITQFLQQLFFNSYFNINLNSKIFSISYNLHWFNFYSISSKNFLLFIIKNLFFSFVLREKFLSDKINLYFFETKNVEYLTAPLLSNYIIRNIQIGHTLNRIIYPLMRNLSQLKMYFNGWKIGCNGRFKRRGRAQRVWYGRTSVPLNTLIANIDYSEHIIRLRNGICCVKVFLNKKSKYVYFF